MYTRNNFPNKRENEVVLMFLRRHWIVLAKLMVMSVAMCFMPVIIYFAILNYTTMWDSASFNGIFILLASAFYLFVLLFTFSNFIDYYLDVWIVTDMRVVNIEQRGLFARTISENDLAKVQDVTSDVKGLVATFLKYGDVFIQTAAEKERFVFKQVPNPDEIARKISNLAQGVQKKVGADLG